MKNGKEIVGQVLKSVAFTLIFVLALILIFALAINAFSISNGVIKAVNCIIKILAVFSGVFISVKNDFGLIKGCVSGVVALAAAYIAFAILGSGETQAINVLWDVALGGVIGAVSGVLAVNLKRKS